MDSWVDVGVLLSPVKWDIAMRKQVRLLALTRRTLLLSLGTLHLRLVLYIAIRGSVPDVELGS